MIKETIKEKQLWKFQKKGTADFQRYLKLFCEGKICYSEYGRFFFLSHHVSHLFSDLKLNTAAVKTNCLSLFKYFYMNKKLFIFSFS